jgi:hypothetical protein
VVFLGSGISAKDAAAAPVLWTVQGVPFPFGGVASGSFVFDADTGTYSDVAVSVSAAGPSFDTSEVLTIDSDESRLHLQDGLGGDLTGLEGMILFFASPLTNAGGTVFLTQVSAQECLDSTCSGFSQSIFISDLGSVVGTPVPEPSAMFLFGAGLLGAGVRRWRERSA